MRRGKRAGRLVKEQERIRAEKQERRLAQEAADTTNLPISAANVASSSRVTLEDGQAANGSTSGVQEPEPREEGEIDKEVDARWSTEDDEDDGMGPRI